MASASDQQPTGSQLDMPEREGDDRPSKSERKRQMLALQRLGEQLLSLPSREWDKLALPEQLTEALLLAQRIKSREGRRRQLQYIGKLMRTIDAGPIEAMLAQRNSGQQQQTRQFHALEQLRDELIEGDASVVDRTIQHYPQAERSRLGQLVRTARRERDQQLTPRAARKLFRYLREVNELQQEESSDERSR